MRKDRYVDIIVLDCGKEMGSSFAPASNQSKFAMAQAAIIELLSQMMCFRRETEIGLVFCGVASTDNSSSSPFKPLLHASAYYGIQRINSEHVSRVNNLLPSGTQADLFDGIFRALALIEENVADAEVKKTIWLFADETHILPQPCSCQILNEHMQTLGISIRRFTLSAPDYFLSNSFSNDSLFPSLQSHLKGMTFSPRILRDLPSKVQSLVQNKSSHFITKLEITGYMKIPIKVYKKTINPALPKLQKVVFCSNRDICIEAYMRRNYIDPNDTMRQHVSPSKTAKVYRYGDELVPYTNAESRAFKHSTEPSISVLSVVYCSMLRKEWMLGNVEYVTPESGNEEACTAFFALVIGMSELGTALICQIITTRSRYPRLCALVPKVVKSAHYFKLTYLPFAEDFRPLMLRSVPKVSQDQLKAAQQLVASFGLVKTSDLGGICCRNNNPFFVSSNPSIMKLYRAIVDHALDSSGNKFSEYYRVAEPVQGRSVPGTEQHSNMGINLKEIFGFVYN